MSRDELKRECEQHFNEIMISFGEIARCVGFGEDDRDCYILCRKRDGKIHWNTMVGGYQFLDALRGSVIVKPTHPKFEGEVWSDYSRLETHCQDIPIEPEFLELRDESMGYYGDVA